MLCVSSHAVANELRRAHDQVGGLQFRLFACGEGRAIRVGFNTNGTLLTERKGRELIDSGLDELRVSLDAVLAVEDPTAAPAEDRVGMEVVA